MRIFNKFRKPFRAILDAYGIPKRERDYYWLTISLITKTMIDSYREEALVSGKAPRLATWHGRLYSKILDRMMGHKYIDVFTNLSKWGVAYRGGSYCVGTASQPGLSKSVWFGEQFGAMLKEYCYAKDVKHLHGMDLIHGGGCMGTMTVTSKVLLKRLEKCAEDRKAAQLSDPVVKDAHDNLQHFHIDQEKAEKTLEKLDIAERRKKRELEKVERFNNANESPTSLYVVRDAYGRVHTNITQVKKEIREHALTCDGGPVAEVDIKSSQGAFLCYILGAYLNGDDALIGRNTKSFIALKPDFMSFLDRNRLNAEYAKFSELLRHKELYEFFGKEMSGDFDLDMDVDRDTAKLAFLSTLFAGTKLSDKCDETWHSCRRVWNEHFPTLLRLIDGMKEENYRALAYEMQRMESSFVFDVVIPAIKKEVGCPYCTVHDSIIVPVQCGSAVKSIVDRELERFGIPTTTVEKRELLEPDNELSDHQLAMDTEVAYWCKWGDQADQEIMANMVAG